MLKNDECLKLIQALERQIREGDFESVRSHLTKMSPKNIPRDHLVKFANLSRRVSLLGKALELLNPIVRPKNRLIKSATALEKAEYAVALQKIGATQEALELLNEVDESELPVSLLYKSFCHFSNWDYAGALPLLERYTGHFQLEDYPRLVAEVNLAAALVIERRDKEAKLLLDSISKKARELNLNLLLGNILELSAQFYINVMDLDTAERLLNEASDLLKKLNSPESLYVEKWKAVIESRRSGGVSERLSHVKTKALELEHWETVRHCDFISSINARDEQTLCKVYFGTPYLSYREKLIKESHPWSPPSFFVWSGDFSDSSRLFDLETASEGKDVSTAAGQLIHKLIVLLCSDLYKPLSLGRAYSHLFPGEYYNPFSSPDRIYQIVKRSKIWLKNNDVPVQLNIQSGGYRLLHSQPYGFVFPQKPLPLDSTELALRKLKRLNNKEFSAQQAKQELGLSLSSANRILASGIDAGLLKKIGSGPKTRYCFTSTPTSE